MLRAYRYRLHPTQAQESALHLTLEGLREIYNAALQERRDAWTKARRSLNANHQMAQMKHVRAVREDIRAIHFHLANDAIKRVDRAFAGFFRRCKSGEKAGYPRFQGRGRYRSFTFGDAGNRNGARLVAEGRRLYLHGVGKIRIRIHRQMQGRLKQITITHAPDGHWYACMVCDDVPMRPLPLTGEGVGLDLGIIAFATLSNGERIDNPRPYVSVQRSLARAQRVVARRKKGSKRSSKAVAVASRHQAKTARVRREFHHCAAKMLVERYDWIVVESLNIRGMLSRQLAKHVCDAGWGKFIQILANKAECAGRELIEVNPAGTSQECSACGGDVGKTLAQRTHVCPNCELVMDRDHNAALNIQRRGRRLRGGSGAGRPDEPRSPAADPA